MRLVFDHDEAVGKWVASRIPHMLGDPFVKFVAVGIAIGNRPIAGVVFSEYHAVYKTMQLSMAADTPRWAQRGIIRGILNYPFEQQDINKLWTATPIENKRAIKFNQGVGFTREAILGHHLGEGNHAVICRMLRKDYIKRYKGKDNGLPIEEKLVAARAH